MKRVAIIFLLLVILTGCGNKDVISATKCHNNTNDGIKSSKMSMVGNFVNDELDTIEITGTFSGEGIAEDRDFYDWFYGDMSKINGISFESFLDEDYTFKVVMDISEIPDDSNFDKNELPTDGASFILYAGKQGYVCE